MQTKTDRQWLDAYLLAKPAATGDFKIEWGWDRYMVGGKMFAALCAPGPEHAPEYAGHPLLTLKCDPQNGEFMRAQYPDILPGFYSDKRNWISIRLDGAVPDAVLRPLCDEAYALIFAKLTKKMQRELTGNAAT